MPEEENKTEEVHVFEETKESLHLVKDKFELKVSTDKIEGATEPDIVLIVQKKLRWKGKKPYDMADFEIAQEEFAAALMERR